MTSSSDPIVIWKPQPGPQTALLSCPIFEVFYGGARGGGKTDGSLGDWLQHANECGSAARGIFIRRVGKQLEEVVARAHSLFSLLGATWREQKAEYKFPSGARLKFRHLERDSDAEHYQGHSYSRLYVEEVTNFPSPEPINKMRATVRSPEGAPVGMRLTGNPGGPGHSWVKERYVTPCKTGYRVMQDRFWNPFLDRWEIQERVFIPARLNDNQVLLQNDPGYVARLQQQGSKELVRAWLDGDWDIALGAFFDCFDPRIHVLPIEWLARVPKDATRFRSFDWGSSKPFCVGWYAVSDGSWGLPRGALIKYREWYGSNGQPNQGLKMDATLVAQGIKEREAGEHIRYGVAGRDAFIRDGGPSIADRMAAKGVSWRPADTKRKTGWDQLRQYLRGNGGLPMLYLIDGCCDDTVRTLPAVPHDEHDPEDVDTESEDHAADETRYAVMSRNPLAKAPSEPPAGPPKGSFGALKTKHLSSMREAREEMSI